ncbi:conserved oligomeric Golgi complex subunit 3 [Nematostella vectensis]|uniref:conserved oligomeric Golgi complex subunit 3 n=1 Tax=Nematostella vectensis TaxID=45351 RepID=UPI0020772867|nr:conserved oligomeric Golgi complex subunit 3 [Nematostella vectensis]
MIPRGPSANMAAVHHSTLPKEVRDNLSFWEGKETNLAPLTDRQKDSALELSALSTRREIPDELPDDDYTHVPAKRSLSESSKETQLDIASVDLGEEKIENAQQFFTWFAQVEAQMEEEQESSYRSYSDHLKKFRDHCDSILEEIEAALSQLHELQRQHVMVSTKTGALHGACEQLLQDQTRLVNMAESISNKLSYFNTLEHLRHKLNSPTLSVNSESFVPLLARLDECISYIASNPQFKESSIYLTRFKQCLNQALSHIRSYIISLLKHATSQVLNNKDAGNAENSFALFYGKFRTCAPRIKSLMEQIEQRSHMTSEYASLLTDCQRCYFEQRSQLLTPCITDAIEKLSKQHEKNPCQLVRSGCSLLIHVCQDEYQLYHHFFSKTCIGLDTLLEGLCNSLYDCLRPVIIHMNHMETLAQLCTILKVEMIEGHVQQKGEELAAFEVIIDQMTEDVQERLVYRAQAYFQTDILMYSPAPGDLAYPDKLLIDLSDDQSETEIGGRKKSSSELPAAPADLQGMWYPTVRRTIVCLSKLDRCISKETFEGLSQEALSACIKSLKIASALITKRKDPINGHLFLIKHLLILREQIAAFDVDFAVKEVSLDFSKMRTAAYGLWSKSGHIFSLNSSNAILEFLLEGAPQLTESYLDSKKEVDRELRVVCEQFIQQVSESFISPLSAFIGKVNVILKLAEDEGKDKSAFLRQQPWAKPESVRKVVSETYMMLKSKLPSTLQSMALFLANKDTEHILFKPVKTKVQEYYKQMNELIAETYTEEDSHIIGCPSIQQVSLLLAVS